MTDAKPVAVRPLESARVTVLLGPGRPDLGAFARARLETFALALPEREQAALVVLCRSLAAEADAFVLEQAAPDAAEEAARHLALETGRPVVLVEQATRVRNAAAALAALAHADAGGKDELGAEKAAPPTTRRLGLTGRATALAPLLRAAGVAPEQLVVVADEPTEARPAPAPVPSPRPRIDPSVPLGKGPVAAATPAIGPVDVLLAPDAPAAPESQVAERVTWAEADVDLVLPYLARAAVDHSTGAALLDEAGCAALARALAALAHQGQLPAPDDPRLLLALAPAAAAALGVAAKAPLDEPTLAAYADALADLRSPLRRVLRPALEAARATARRLVFTHGDDVRVVRAARLLADEGLAVPWLLGDLFRLETRAKDQGVSLKGIRVLDPARDKRRGPYAQALAGLAGPGVLGPDEAARLVEEPTLFAALAVLQGEADGALLTEPRADGLEALGMASDLLGRRDEFRHLAGVHLLVLPASPDTVERVLLITDTAGASDPTSEDVADAALQAAWLARTLLGRAPRVALLSHTTAGAGPTAARHDPAVRRLALARDVVRARAPELAADGPMTFAAALEAATNQDDVLVLVVPDRAAGATLVGALRALAGAEALGPLVPALGRPLVPAARDATTDDLVLLAALTCALAVTAPRAPGDDADDPPSRALKLPTPSPTRRATAALASSSTSTAPAPAPTSGAGVLVAEPPPARPRPAPAPSPSPAPAPAPSRSPAPAPSPPPSPSPSPSTAGGLAEKPSDVGLTPRAAPPPRTAPPPKAAPRPTPPPAGGAPAPRPPRPAGE